MSSSVEPWRMDELWAEGWRHFGVLFFRDRKTSYGGRRCSVMPLRVELERFTPSRSQRRVLARNSDAEIRIGETFIDREKRDLFERHKRRFHEAVPDSLYDFLSHAPASVPCRNVEICVSLGGRLAAASFLDVGESATSAVYAMFDPEESKRSLGIFTMLVAIRYSLILGCRHYYPGYACREPSIYDYKKNFAGVEYFDWRGVWGPLDAA
ncbi:MAG: GNAT family N-acetyltransferase [Acidobacteria bacterium]|nr:GNAT family N-acetyltransferase [Acidobacteriota bacterium]